MEQVTFRTYDDIRPLTPILLHDLAMGVVVHHPGLLPPGQVPGSQFGVRVADEADDRWVTTSNLYQNEGMLLEVLPAYADTQLDTMLDRLRSIDADAARSYIDALQLVGFDITYDDYRPLQDGAVVTFLFNQSPRLAGRLTVKAISHRPTFCARHGHQWDGFEAETNGDMYQTCGWCGCRQAISET